MLPALAVFCAAASNPKTEFRGAWLHTVHQGQYARQTTEQNKAYLIRQLDSLQNAGINTIIFQVRPSADALYKSKYEPWSRFLSGKAGVAPDPEWDPLQFMIEQSHKRGMELHAWLNPYRVTTSNNEKLPANHIYNKHPERFLKYDGKLYFDPGLPENRKFINDVVRDIVSNYDVDAIHMDDYFYPYPKPGVPFPDSKSFAKYGNGMELGDWRRHNVDLLIEGLHNTIISEKPWVRLGISPFGIWRNKKSDPQGSETSGLQNYDDLYADVLLWTKNGWVDYMLPQLYWELEHKRASTLVLADWWNDHANGRHMYFGQDVWKTMDKADLEPSKDTNQLRHKIEISRNLPNVQGNCWWAGYAVTKNHKGVADSLANNFQSTIALNPNFPWIKSEPLKAVSNLHISDGKLIWNAPRKNGKTSDIVRFVVYQTKNGADSELENPENILAVTDIPEFNLPALEKDVILIVTPLDRVNNEGPASKGVKY